MARITLEDALKRPRTVDRSRIEATTEDDIRRHMIEDGEDPDAEIDPASYVDVAPSMPPRRSKVARRAKA